MQKEENPDIEESYKKSLEILKKCSSDYGFRASLNKKDKYSRIWARDSMICSLAAMKTDNNQLIKQAEKSVKTLLKFQYKHGQIPSNVDVKNKKISYGGTSGRIDAILWFLIGFSQYVKKTNNTKFLKTHYRKFKKSFELINLYEFNNKGFIYVPKGGDWADEFIQEGYVLYDQILYYQAIKEFIYLRKKLRKKSDELIKKANLLKKKIKVNFLLEKKNIKSPQVYHKTLFKRAVEKKKKNYLLPYFNPSNLNP
jgi:GH15 family glucan-1,4-alpha-glucosidase